MKRLLSLALLLLGFASVTRAQVVATGCTSGEVQTAITAATQGQTVTIPACPSGVSWTAGVTVSGKGIKIQGAGAGRIIAYSSTTLTLGTGAKTLTVSGTGVSGSPATPIAPTITAGQTLRISETGARANFMQGTVTSFSAGSLVMNITSAGGTCGVPGGANGSNCKRWLVSTIPQTVFIDNFNGTMFSVTEDATLHTELSGFKIQAGTGTGAGVSFSAGGGKAILLHDCWIEQNSTSTDSVHTAVNRGVIWNCSFDSSPFSMAPLAIHMQPFDTTAWTTTSFWGMSDATGQNNLYIENSDFHAYLNAADNDEGARSVWRYNTMNNAGFGTHGVDTSPLGQRYFEYYNNFGNFNGYTDGSTFNMNWWFFVRGGTFVVHDNTLPQLSSQDYGAKPDTNVTVMNLQRSNGPNPCWGAGTANGALYYAPRQVGIGNVTGTGHDGKGNSTYSAASYGFGTQYSGDSEPAYLWNNSRTLGVSPTNYGPGQPESCTGTVDSSNNYIVSGRDYFNGTAKPNYMPFTFPHPFTSSSPVPILSITPNPVAFGNQNIGTNSSIAVTVKNIGAANEVLASSGAVAVSGSSVFSVVAGSTCTNSLSMAPNTTCLATVKCAPVATGSFTGTLTISGTVNATANLSCAGTSSISIPSVPAGVSASVSGSTVTVSWTASTGTPQGYLVSRATVSGGPYTQIANVTNGTSYANTGLANGTYYYVVSAYNTAGTSANSTQVSATVNVIPLVPAATFAPSGLAFGSVVLGNTSASQDVTLTNTGTATLSSITVNTPSGPNAADFALTNSCPASLAVSASCIFSVTFTPSFAGSGETASIVITSNDPNSPDTVSLSGAGAFAVGISPTSLSFGNVFTNKVSAAQVVTFTNSSGATITFTSVLVTGGDSTQFTKGANSCIATLANGLTCTTSVTFTPSALGSKTSTLVFTFTGANGSPVSVPLTGTSSTHKVRKGVLF